MVRAPAGYTPLQFLAAATKWRTLYRSGADPRAAFTAFTRSVTFVGGAVVASGGVGAFAQGFSAGTYFLYEDTFDGPTHLSRIRVLTVVGTAPAQTAVPFVGLVRFSATNEVTLPAHLPVAGWLKPIGGAPLNALLIRKLAPGVTNADLDTRGVCFDAGVAPASKNCFETSLRVGGNVSAGASAYWYYRLAPGEYVTGNIATNAYYDRAFYDGIYARFTVS